MRCGGRKPRRTAVAAAASGGATTAPSAIAGAHDMAGISVRPANCASDGALVNDAGITSVDAQGNFFRNGDEGIFRMAADGIGTANFGGGLITVNADGSLGPKKILVDFGHGTGTDGMTTDTAGRIYCAIRGEISGRSITEAAAPLLPGFARPPEFVF